MALETSEYKEKKHFRKSEIFLRYLIYRVSY